MALAHLSAHVSAHPNSYLHRFSGPILARPGLFLNPGGNRAHEKRPRHHLVQVGGKLRKENVWKATGESQRLCDELRQIESANQCLKKGSRENNHPDPHPGIRKNPVPRPDHQRRTTECGFSCFPAQSGFGFLPVKQVFLTLLPAFGGFAQGVRMPCG